MDEWQQTSVKGGELAGAVRIDRIWTSYGTNGTEYAMTTTSFGGVVCYTNFSYLRSGVANGVPVYQPVSIVTMSGPPREPGRPQKFWRLATSTNLVGNP